MGAMSPFHILIIFVVLAIVIGALVGVVLLIVKALGSKPRPVAGAIPAGWYPDPQGAPTQRYWDGAQWTEHTVPSQ